MNTCGIRSLWLLWLVALVAAPARADVVSVSGGMLLIAPPASVDNGVLEDDTHMVVFPEKTTFTLAAPVDVDITAAGTPVDLPAQLTPMTIPAGTLVDSYYVHHDQVGVDQNLNQGSVTFDTDVIGIVVLVGNLVAGDAQLGAAGTTYTATEINQGLELTASCDTTTNSQDRVTLSADRRTVQFCTNVYAYPDDIRILVKGRVPVSIDIKPGSFPNSIKLESHGKIPVAILGGTGVDVSQIDVSTLVFAGASALRAAYEDVNHDGIADLVLKFKTSETNLQLGDVTACVTGSTVGGTPFRGCDSVRILDKHEGWKEAERRGRRHGKGGSHDDDEGHEHHSR